MADAPWPEWLTPDEIERLEERAAIMEYEAGLTRRQAESEAIRDLLASNGSPEGLDDSDN